MNHIRRRFEVSRIYVRVRCDQQSDGTVSPKELIWPDGRSWEIRKTLHMAAPVEDEFEGIRYTVIIGSAERYIYKAGHAWYVMA